MNTDTRSLLAAVSLDARRTAAVAAYAVVLAILLGVADGIFGTLDHVVRCLVVAFGGIFCAFIAERRSQRERALLRITRVAEVAQRAILVQVLLAFLLTAPFQQRFAQLPGTLRNVFFASIACATVATALLIAPSAHHRLRWREGQKERLLHVANREAIWGTVFLATAIVLALYVVTDVLFATWVAVVTAAVAFAVFAVLWYMLPLLGGSSREESPG